MAGIVNKVKLAIFRFQDSNVHVKSAGLVFCEVPTIQEPGSGYVTIFITIIIIIKIIFKIGTIELITTFTSGMMCTANSSLSERLSPDTEA